MITTWFWMGISVWRSEAWEPPVGSQLFPCVGAPVKTWAIIRGLGALTLLAIFHAYYQTSELGNNTGLPAWGEDSRSSVFGACSWILCHVLLPLADVNLYPHLVISRNCEYNSVQWVTWVLWKNYKIWVDFLETPNVPLVSEVRAVLCRLILQLSNLNIMELKFKSHMNIYYTLDGHNLLYQF